MREALLADLGLAVLGRGPRGFRGTFLLHHVVSMRRFLAGHGGGIAVRADAEVARLPQDAVHGPVLKGHLDHELGFHPDPLFAGALLRLAVERTVLACQLVDALLPLAPFARVESAADPAAVLHAL